MDRRAWEYTVREVATLAGVSVDTVKRRLRRHAFPHARQLPGPVGTWLIPLDDLVASGLRLSADLSPPQASRPENASEAVRTSRIRDLAELRIKAAVAEAEARVHREYADALNAALNGLAGVANPSSIDASGCGGGDDAGHGEPRRA